MSDIIFKDFQEWNKLEKSKHPNKTEIKDISVVIFSLVATHKSLVTASTDYKTAYHNYKNQPDEANAQRLESKKKVFLETSQVLLATYKELLNIVLPKTLIQQLTVAVPRIEANLDLFDEKIRSDRKLIDGLPPAFDIALTSAIIADVLLVFSKGRDLFKDIPIKHPIAKALEFIGKLLEPAGDTFTLIANHLSLITVVDNQKLPIYEFATDGSSDLTEKFSAIVDALKDIDWDKVQDDFIRAFKQGIIDLVTDFIPDSIENYWDKEVGLLSADNTDNTVIGGILNDLIKGYDGNDKLYGLLDDDTLDGGNGNDTLKGGSGNDLLVGGKGFDTYHIEDHDTVYDSDGQGKIIFKGGFFSKDVEFSQAFEDTLNETWAYKVKGKTTHRAYKDGKDLIIERSYLEAEYVNKI